MAPNKAGIMGNPHADPTPWRPTRRCLLCHALARMAVLGAVLSAWWAVAVAFCVHFPPRIPHPSGRPLRAVYRMTPTHGWVQVRMCELRPGDVFRVAGMPLPMVAVGAPVWVGEERAWAVQGRALWDSEGRGAG